MFNYIPLKSILRLIPKGIRNEESDTNLLGYALDALRDFNLHQNHVKNAKIIPIINHKVDLPKGLKLINHVLYTCEPTKEEEISLLTCYNNVNIENVQEDTNCNSCSIKIECGCPGVYFTNDVNAYCSTCACNSCITEKESFETRTNNICRPTLNYQLFLDNTYSHNYSKLKYVGNSNCVLSKNCQNRYYNCSNTFSFSPSNTQLIVSEKEGYVYIEYMAENRNEKGEFLIPKETSLEQGLASFAIAMSWRNRSAVKEQGANSMYLQELQIAEAQLRKARGRLIQASIDDNLVREIIGYDEYNSRMSRLPSKLIQQRKYYRR